MPTVQERLAAGEMVPVAEVLAELTAAYPRTGFFEQWCARQDLAPVVVNEVACLLRAIERTQPELLMPLMRALECNQPGITLGLTSYNGD
jgi:hypothetical protein